MSDSSVPPDDELADVIAAKRLELEEAGLLPIEGPELEELGDVSLEGHPSTWRPAAEATDVPTDRLSPEQVEAERLELAEANAVAILTLQANGIVPPTDIVYLKVLLEFMVGPWEITRARLIYERAVRDAIPAWRAAGEAQREQMIREQLTGGGNRAQRRGGRF